MSTDPFINRRILVVDDNRAIHSDYRKILCAKPRESDWLDQAEKGFFGDTETTAEKPSFQLDSAYQGQEGLDLVAQAHAENRRYALAFIDVRMPPGMDGIETAARLWKLDPEVQVVICTAYSDYVWEEIVAKVGQSDRWVILRKPFDNVEVLQLASALTEKWRLLQHSKSRLNDLEARFLRAQRMESIGTLASGVAHDLNNILAPIVMGVAILRANHQSEEDKELLDLLEGNTQRGIAIIKQLLTFARGAQGERVPVVPKHLIHEILGIARETFPKSIRVTGQIDGDLRMVSGDPTQIHQVLMNLCVNARDVMPSGGELVLRARNVEIKAPATTTNPEAKPGPYVLVEVSDSGWGIEPEVLPRIFDPFFTTKEPGKGTGLGLSTALGIVKSYGGFLQVESKVGHGTTFQVYLPAIHQEKSGESRLDTPRRVAEGKGQLILIVDDEASIRETTANTLQRHGYEVITAADGANGLIQFFEHQDRIRLVLTDLLMPVMDGRALILALRQTRPRLPIIVHSGMAEGTQIDDLRTQGIAAFLDKPYPTKALLEAMEAALDRKNGEGHEACAESEVGTGQAGPSQPL